MGLRKKSLVFAFLLFVFGSVIGIYNVNVSSISLPKKNVPLLVLKSSSRLIKNFDSNSSLTRVPQDAESLYSLDSASGEISIYKNGSKIGRKNISSVSDVEAFAVSSQGNTYLAKRNATIEIFDSAGSFRNSFPITRTQSIAVLSNGNVVVASPLMGKLLHVYSRKGKLLKSIGDLRKFDFSNVLENDFLNRGKVVVGSNDEIYFVSKYAPSPFVLKFSADGTLLSEFAVSGDAIDYQLEKANDFLQKKATFQVGGFTVITSASIHPKTGNLWIGMNGLSTTGNIYEYDKTGAKIREYAFIVKPELEKLFNVTHLKDISVSESSVSILTWGGTYEFMLSDVVASGSTAQVSLVKEQPSIYSNLKYFLPGKSQPSGATISFRNPLIDEGGCSPGQDYSCTSQCPNGSTPGSVDCGAEIYKRIKVDDVVTSSTCSKKTIDDTSGSSSPGGCAITAQVCNKGNGVTGTLAFEVNCNAVPTPAPTPPPDPDPEPTPTPRGEIGGGCEGNIYSCFESPIVIDVSGNGFSMTNAANGVSFDITSDGIQEQLSWTSANSDDAWLALDRNANRMIDNGKELFGNYTAQPVPPANVERNDFLALAEFDKTTNGGNGDGSITAQDTVFQNLRLWQDSNHNGISEANELHTLPELGIAELELKYHESKRTDEFGNQFRYRAKVWDVRGARAGRWAWDVFLTSTK